MLIMTKKTTHQVHIPAMTDLNKRFVVNIAKTLKITQSAAIEMVLSKARTAKIIELKPVVKRVAKKVAKKVGTRSVRTL
jgi:hypothetical protein